ncbi:chymotrypsin B-like [Branchiostoma floridae x Branchiostoma belcheri]
MQVFVALAALLAVANGCGQQAIQPRTMGMTRVVNGEDAAAHSWPWQASLQTSSSFHYCGGVLISDQWVLSAAHCYQSDYSTHSVILGEHDRSRGTEDIQVIPIEQEIVHERYSSRTIENDIMLVKLSRPASLGDHVSVACLPDQGETHHEVASTCWITGWGRLDGDQDAAQVLQQANLPLRSDTQCSSSWGRNYDSVSMLCAGLNGSGGCMGDSGGPFVCERNGAYDIVGLVSWGSSSCSTSYPTVFARVAAYKDWIQQRTGLTF